MLRHGLAAFLLLALLTPLVPAGGGGMACCRGATDACVCPLTSGFARCDVAPTLKAPQTLPALLQSAPLFFLLAVSCETPAFSLRTPASLAPSPLVPPPRF